MEIEADVADLINVWNMVIKWQPALVEVYAFQVPFLLSNVIAEDKASLRKCDGFKSCPAVADTY